jgi:hypothetical protein
VARLFRGILIKLNLSIRWKLILSIIVPLIIITSIIMGFTLSRINTFAILNIQKNELGELDLYANQIAAEFNGLGQIATTTANILSLVKEISDEEIYNLLMRNVSDNPLIYGAAIAFEPFSFHEDKRLFAPYVHQSADNLAAIDIGEDSYDYSDGNWEWYSAVRESGEAVWTEPYFDEGAGDVLMTTFSVPFFRDGNFAGVATLDIRLDALRELTAREFGDKNFILLSLNT